MIVLLSDRRYFFTGTELSQGTEGQKADVYGTISIYFALYGTFNWLVICLTIFNYTL